MEIKRRETSKDFALYQVDYKGKTYEVKRNFFPSLSGREKLISVPDCDEETERNIVSFLIRNHKDFASAILVRKHRCAFSRIKDCYYSVEQALYNADTMWKENGKDFEEFYIKANGKMIKDYKKEINNYEAC